MNWKNGLVAIFSPTTGAVDSGVYGTAFPVAKDVIVTARHVIFPDNADTTRPIKLRWWYSEVGWEPYDDREKLVIWHHERFDVALLRVEMPTAIADRCWLTPRKPPKDGRWESEGFPTAARIEDMVRPTSVAGITMTKADREDYFQVTLDPGLATSNPKGWGGASGMPIVVDGYVLGVAVRVEENFQSVIQAAPVWKFWDSIRDYFVPEESTAEFEKKRSVDWMILSRRLQMRSPSHARIAMSLGI